MTTGTDRIEAILQDAREIQASAVACLDQRDIRDAAEKAWRATKRATEALVLARTGEKPEGTPETGAALRLLESMDEAVREGHLVARYYTRWGQLHRECGHSGLCDPRDDTERRVRDTAGYIEDAARLAGAEAHGVPATSSSGLTLDPEGPAIVKSLTAIFNIGIRRIVKYEGDRPTYAMFTEHGYITLDQIRSITSQARFRNAVAAATGILIPKCKDKIWEQRAQAILTACETVNMGVSSHPDEETFTWLYDYLAERPAVASIDEATQTRIPFLRNANTYIFLDNFQRWVDCTSDTKRTSRAMSQRLRNCGALAEVISVTVDQKRTTRSCWRLPGKHP